MLYDNLDYNYNISVMKKCIKIEHNYVLLDSKT